MTCNLAKACEQQCKIFTEHTTHPTVALFIENLKGKLYRYTAETDLSGEQNNKPTATDQHVLDRIEEPYCPMENETF